jgi:hypothetical protein
MAPTIHATRLLAESGGKAAAEDILLPTILNCS